MLQSVFWASFFLFFSCDLPLGYLSCKHKFDCHFYNPGSCWYLGRMMKPSLCSCNLASYLLQLFPFYSSLPGLTLANKILTCSDSSQEPLQGLLALTEAPAFSIALQNSDSLSLDFKLNISLLYEKSMLNALEPTLCYPYIRLCVFSSACSCHV